MLKYSVPRTNENNEEYIEEERLSILMTGKYITGINTKVMVDFYYIKGIVENILDYLGYKKRYDFNILNTVKELHPYQSARVNINGIEVGFLGKMHPIIYKDDVYVCEINLTKLKSIKTEKMKYKEMSKYPKMEKDISFIALFSLYLIFFMNMLKNLNLSFLYNL